MWWHLLQDGLIDSCQIKEGTNRKMCMLMILKSLGIIKTLAVLRKIVGNLGVRNWTQARWEPAKLQNGTASRSLEPINAIFISKSILTKARSLNLLKPPTSKSRNQCFYTCLMPYIQNSTAAVTRWPTKLKKFHVSFEKHMWHPLMLLQQPSLSSDSTLSQTMLTKPLQQLPKEETQRQFHSLVLRPLI